MIKLPAMDFPVEKMINTARAAKEAAYAPYSGLRVGAALLTSQGRLYKGCNIENVSYGLTVCAERVAFYKAFSEGERQFAAMAVISDLDGFCSPCGACRQVLSEFGADLKIYICSKNGEFIVKTLTELLPEPFIFRPSS
ncbi:MAG: Cytidine deaminase [Desulfotomaculum sp. 46_296]|nr:MAG: Cytidine deaminase [Desulfotomaculum sp. 46_296]KUK84777.1 MAG: Cytidine deaminase [Desulfofundulus kuznetsovii]